MFSEMIDKQMTSNLFGKLFNERAMTADFDGASKQGRFCPCLFDR
jgi:hypothetical protein